MRYYTFSLREDINYHECHINIALIFFHLFRVIFLELNAKHIHAPKIAFKDIDN